MLHNGKTTDPDIHISVLIYFYCFYEVKFLY